MSIKRDYTKAQTDIEALYPATDLNKLYATGPLKTEKCECCRFSSRIPHYLWTSHLCHCLACTCYCPKHQYRTCMRLGNFTVLLERVDGSQGSELLLVVGPHWPFAVVFTCGITISFPAIVIYIFWGIVPIEASYFVVAVACVVLFILFVLGCSDPGIAKRIRDKPPDEPGQLNTWIWNDQASTWRMTTDSYSHEMNVVLHDVDHICPFTGTAIARKNIAWFLAFQVAVILLGLSLVIYVCWGMLLLSF